MNETHRTDALRELTAAQLKTAAAIELQAAEMKAGREEMAAWRAELRAAPASMSATMGPPAQWCGIGLVAGLLLMAWIKRVKS